MALTWSQWKEKRELHEVGLPSSNFGGDGASTPRPRKPSHPEIAGAFKGPPADFRAAGRDQPPSAMHPGVRDAVEQARRHAAELLHCLEILPPPLYDRFYGYTEWLTDLAADLSQVK